MSLKLMTFYEGITAGNASVTVRQVSFKYNHGGVIGEALSATLPRTVHCKTCMPFLAGNVSSTDRGGLQLVSR